MGAGTDPAQLPLQGRRDGEVAAGPGQPQRQQRVEAGRPGIAGGFPDRREDGDDLRGIGRRSTSARLLGGARGAVEQGNGVLAVMARRGTELIQNAGLRAPRGEGIARADGTDILASGGRGHRGLRGDRLGDGAR